MHGIFNGITYEWEEDTMTINYQEQEINTAMLEKGFRDNATLGAMAQAQRNTESFLAQAQQGCADNPPPKPESHMATQRRRTTEALNSLFDNVKTLEDKLSVVTRFEKEEEEKVDKENYPEIVPLAIEMFTNVKRIQESNSIIKSIIERLEL